MENIFITGLDIHKVRHLNDISIPLSKSSRKNLIFTGKNGSGKTSVLDSVVHHLEYVVSDNFYTKDQMLEQVQYFRDLVNKSDDSSPSQIDTYKSRMLAWSDMLSHWQSGCTANYTSLAKLREKYKSGQFIIAHYSDNRKINIAQYKNIEKVDLKPVYGIYEKPSEDLGKYLVNLKSIQAFANTKGDVVRAEQIDEWFRRFENILRRIYQDNSLVLDFDIETFQFSININGREPFAFNAMSMGYAAVFEIISDLIMRMESQHRYDLEGIVLIDEIETHLHVELQKEIVPILTELFPNIQFILTTHSPFVLSSAQNAVVYDLEKNLLVEEGLTDLPYEGIVEGYFKVDLLSQELRKSFEEYKILTQKSDLTDADYAKMVELESYLDEVPDYLALDFAEEYNRLKVEFDSRG